MTNKSAVMYGSGNIGRGFIGQLFSRSGYDVSFVDVNKDVLRLLNTEKEYPVRMLLHDGFEEEMVKNVSGVDGTDVDAVATAIASADIMATAVGVNVLKFIVEPIAKGIMKRFETNKKPLNIIICENLLEADKFLRKSIGEKLDGEVLAWFNENVGLVEASIGRMVPLQTPEMQEGNPLRVTVEKFGQLPVDRNAFKGDIPQINSMIPFAPFDFYIERKLFIHNMGHALCAYFGYIYGHEFICDAIAVPEIELLALRAMTQSAIGLNKKHGVPFYEINDHVEDLLLRFGNKQLGDTSARVGNDLRRKLSPNDRMIGALNMCIQTGSEYKYICLGVAAALCFEHDSLLAEMSPSQILSEISNIDLNSDAAKMILSFYEKLQLKPSLSEVSEMVKLA